MKVISFLRLFGITAGLVQLVSVAQSAVIISNIGTTGTGNVALGASTTAEIGYGFTMGDTAFSLDSVSLRLEKLEAGTDPNVRIYSDSSSAPGTLIASFSALSLTLNTEETATVTPLSSVTLQANTAYWIVLERDGGANATWYRGSEPSGDHATHLGRQLSTDDGASWSGLSTGSTSRLGIEIVASAVPEPEEVALVSGLGLVAFAVWRRRRQKSASADAA